MDSHMMRNVKPFPVPASCRRLHLKLRTLLSPFAGFWAGREHSQWSGVVFREGKGPHAWREGGGSEEKREREREAEAFPKSSACNTCHTCHNKKLTALPVRMRVGVQVRGVPRFVLQRSWPATRTEA